MDRSTFIEEARRDFVGRVQMPRQAVVTLFRGSRAVAASSCWPGDGTEEAKRLTEALGHNRHTFTTISRSGSSTSSAGVTESNYMSNRER